MCNIQLEIAEMRKRHDIQMFKINDDSQEAAALADFSNIDKSKSKKDSKVLPYGKVNEDEENSKTIDYNTSTPNSVQKFMKPQIYSESEMVDSSQRKLNSGFK